MNIAARNYTSGAEIIASANAVHQRLMGRPPQRKQPMIAVAAPDKPKPRPRSPMWRKWPIKFDAHVIEWRERMLSPCKAHMRSRCKELGITMKALCGLRRTHPLVDYRQLIMWELKTIVKPEMSYPELGRLFGGRDHTTGLHAVRRIAEKKAKGML
ncbi:helix-turn-helix domain-containing protein [Rhizobium sp. Root1220]|uniref:helix-turn-helix domain-containing protein n=1 Tax=Rhizobium sp. Root1220 TaxID=1736432 RepID=UPI0006F2DC09|nr:helix-turn-helix domain-containing protein [Rhizobium sp. Root1220]KQV83259.1 hypothetical protein ASC90_21950 [Rhizobium sp. Root1220]